MPVFICKVPDGDRAYYLEWGTVVDAPLTNGMSREAFEAYYLSEYGASAAESFADRMTRAEAHGTSCRGGPQSFAELIAYNRAGKGETELTMEQIVDYYCRRGGEGEPPVGTRRSEDAG